MIGREHRYESCRDGDCERPYCRIWREAWAEAKETWFQPRYDEGFADGLAARPLEEVVVYVSEGSSS